MPDSPEIETRLFPDDGETPNNPTLPLVLMRHTAAAATSDPAKWFEERFSAHGWSGCWRWTVYPYHHFHSDNHEVLGVSRGEAILLLGGKNGVEFQVKTGDVIIIPAGTGHKSLRCSDDFQVVGAYPGGKEPDLVRPEKSNPGSLRGSIAEVPLPAQDPVYGENGPLFQHWKR